MNRGPHPLAWGPPFVVGVAAAMAAEGSAGLLLYSGAGFLRALTLILVTLFGALAIGIWSAPGTMSDPVGSLRRRWHLELSAFLVAGLVALAWLEFGGFDDPVMRGLGLAALGALPLYATGHLLGALAVVRGVRDLRGPGAPAALGAAVGALITGLFLPRTPAPALLYGLGLIMVWLGALLHGRVLDQTLATDEVPVMDIRLLAPPSEERGATP